MKNKIFTLIMILLAAFVLSACGALGAQPGADLAGTSWILTAYGDKQPIETKPTLRFDEERVFGSASCNDYGGSYQVSGNSISFSELFNTEMFCMEPEGIMDQESLFLQMLGNVERFEMSENQLFLFTSDGVQLTFVPAE